jgi:stage II sporulation protein D
MAIYGKKVVIIAILIACNIAVLSSASESIRVAVADNQKTVVLKSSMGLVLEGARQGRVEKKMTFGADYAGAGQVRVISDDGFVQVNGRSYRGTVEVRKKKNGALLVVNELDLEDYLMGVIAAEMPHDWEPEALKAQAVVARAFALHEKKAAGRRPYHILATVNGQVYSGRLGERQAPVRAVRETRGLVLTYAGEVIPAFYHSSCGGHTEDALELWSIDAPYLKGVDCDCQKISKYGAWERRFSLASFASALRTRGYRLQGITGVKTGSVTPAGRVRDVEIVCDNGTMSVPAEHLREAIGYNQVPSIFFETAVSGQDVVISGRGRGHGVGLCQWGAKTLAQEGYDYRSILRHYYPGTRLTQLDDQ